MQRIQGVYHETAYWFENVKCRVKMSVIGAKVCDTKAIVTIVLRQAKDRVRDDMLGKRNQSFQTENYFALFTIALTHDLSDDLKAQKHL